MSMSQFEGCVVEVDCSVLGVYSGIIKSINEVDQAVHLTRASKDGQKLASPDVHIAAADIEHIRFVKLLSKSSPTQTSERTISTKSPRTPKIDSNNRLNSNGRPKSRTMSQKASQRAAKDKECFGLDMDDLTLKEDFDFEENLKLFNKKAVFAEIERNNNITNNYRNIHQDNVVTKSNKITAALGENRKNFRHDENVISNADKVLNREVEKSSKFTVCTSGIPLSPYKRSERDQILTDAIRQGVSAESMCEAMARNISNLILQQNKRTTVVFVVSVEKISTPLNVSLCGLRAARQLAGKVENLSIICNRKTSTTDGVISTELELCRMAGISILDANSIPPKFIDLIVGCTLHPFIDLHGKSPSVTVMLVDPPFYSVNLANLVIFPLLPLTSSVPSQNDPKCKLFIGDLGIPSKLYGGKDFDAAKLYPSDGFISKIKHT